MIKQSRAWNISIFILYSLFVVATFSFVISVFDFNLTCKLKTDKRNDYMLDFFKGNSTLLNEISIVESKRREYEQIIIFLIDDLRFDETILIKEGIKKFHNQFQILENIETKYPNNSWHFKNFADIPTYTALRLKSISMGIFPNFYEFHKNLNSKNILGDSLFYLLRDKGKKVFHIGDTSILKLHTPDVFSKSFPYSSSGLHNTTSEDLEFVDKIFNVALKNKSNEIIYFHVLGLDFFGHLYGILNDNYVNVLKVYEKVVEKIITEICNETLLIVIGDHGKTYSGDHGSSSKDETETTSFFFTKRIINKNKIFSEPLSQIFINKFYGSKKYNQVAIELFSNGYNHKFDYQINLCTTFAAIFNIPVPRCNEGIYIPELIDYQNLSSFSEYFYLVTIEHIKIFGQIASMIKEFPPDENMGSKIKILNPENIENIINEFKEIVNSKNNIFSLEMDLKNLYPSFKVDDNDLNQIFQFMTKNMDIQIKIRSLIMEYQSAHRHMVFNFDIVGPSFLLIFITFVFLLTVIHYSESRKANINLNFGIFQIVSILLVYLDLVCCFIITNVIFQIVLTPLLILSFYQLLKKLYILVSNFLRSIDYINKIFIIMIILISLIWILSSILDGWSKNEGGVMHYFICILCIVLVLYSKGNLKSNLFSLGIILTCLFLISTIFDNKLYFKRKESFSFMSFLLFILIPILLIKRTLYISISRTIEYFIKLKFFGIIHVMNEVCFIFIVLSEYEIISDKLSNWIIVEVQFILLLLSFLLVISFIYIFSGNQNEFNNSVCEDSTEKMKIKVSIILNISFNFFYLLEPKSLPIVILLITIFFISIKYLSRSAPNASKLLQGFILFCSMTIIFYALEHFKKFDNIQFEYVNIGFNYPALVVGFTLGFFNTFGPFVLTLYSYIFAYYYEISQFNKSNELLEEKEPIPEENENFIARSLRATQIFFFLSFIGKSLNLLINLHLPLEEYAPRVIFETLVGGVSVVMHFFITHWLLKSDTNNQTSFNRQVNI